MLGRYLWSTAWSMVPKWSFRAIGECFVQNVTNTDVSTPLSTPELVQNKRSHKSYFGAAAQQHTSSTAVTIYHNVVCLGCLGFLESKKSPKMSHVKGAGCIWLPCFRSTGNKQAAGKALHHSSQSDRSTLQKHTACASHRSAQRATPSTENSQVHT